MHCLLAGLLINLLIWKKVKDYFESRKEAANVELIEEILSEENLKEAIKRVKANKGAPGIDERSVNELDDYFLTHKQDIYLERQRIESTRKYIYTEKGYYLGEEAELGDSIIIEPGCIIGHGVTIGDNKPTDRCDVRGRGKGGVVPLSREGDMSCEGRRV